MDVNGSYNVFHLCWGDEAEQIPTETVPGSWCTRSQITAVFAAEVGLGVGLKSWNLKLSKGSGWIIERFREMGPDPELIQSITGKEVCFNGKQQVLCGSFVSVITRNLLSLSLLFYFYSWLQGLHQKRKTSCGQLCVWSSTQKKRLGNLMGRWESPIARNFPTWMSHLFCPGGWPILRQCLYL